MSGKYIYRPATVPHVCDLPKCDDPLGTVWQCDSCGVFWKRDWPESYGEATWSRDLWRNIRWPKFS